MNRLLAVVLCLALAACGGYRWVKPGMTSAVLEADLTACDSRTSHLEKDDPEAVAVVDGCMASRGYEKTKTE